MRKEKKILVWMFGPLSAIEPAYLIYKITKVSLQWTTLTILVLILQLLIQLIPDNLNLVLT